MQMLMRHVRDETRAYGVEYATIAVLVASAVLLLKFHFGLVA